VLPLIGLEDFKTSSKIGPAEWLFVDPIGDIAVLGLPDDQELYDKYVRKPRLSCYRSSEKGSSAEGALTANLSGREPIRRQRCVPGRGLQAALAKRSSDRGVVAIVGELVAGRTPKHVRMHRKR
jgi:hypothetical protein